MAAYEASSTGDYRPLYHLLSTLSAEQDDAAWGALCQMRASLVDGAMSPPEGGLANFARHPKLHGFAQTDAVVRAVLRLDARALSLAQSESASDDALHARAWRLLFSGEYAAAQEAADALAPRAAKAKRGDLRSYAATASALAQLCLGQIEEAVAVARKAVRMARAEGILFSEYVSGTVLARARRIAGLPHLAARILASLRRVVPAPIGAWVEWEQALVGEASVADDANAAFGAPRALHAMVRAADQGDERGLASSSAAAVDALHGVAFLADEFRIVRAAFDTREPTAYDEDADRWLAGGSDAIPSALTGFCSPEVGLDGAEIAGAFILVDRAQRPRRVVRGALPLLEADAPPPVPRTQVRTLTALAALAFAEAKGLEDAALFEQVYGFAMDGPRHGGTLRQLVHRMRDYLGARGRIERRSGGYVLEAAGPFVLPDPRCTPDHDELILRFLGSHGGSATTHEVAEALGLALRRVQVGMQRLVGAGACQAERQGRTFNYALEDTTFCQPTLARLAPVVS
ncbi:MAG: hypothetical protein AAF938_15530 [Myxococcota bacterium]